MKTLKKFTLLLILAVSNNLHAQFQFQTYLSNKETEVLGIFDKDFKSNSKLNYFSSAIASYNYEAEELSAELYTNLNYELIDNWGVSVGATISKDDVSPLVGLAYLYEKNAFSFSLFPAINYSFDAKEIGYGFYSLVEYMPKINDKFNFYSMLIIESDFSSGKHASSNQVIRLGLQTLKKLQFGIGSNISQIGDNFDSDANFGVFIGKEF